MARRTPADSNGARVERRRDTPLKLMPRERSDACSRAESKHVCIVVGATQLPQTADGEAGSGSGWC